MNEILKEMKAKMESAVEAVRREFAAIHTGRATPLLLEKIKVDYYGTPTPLNQIAGISTPDPHLILVQPWDKMVIKDVEKAILQADIGLTPNNDGNVVKIPVPQLSDERREELITVVRRRAEEGRVSVRGMRREYRELIKKREKASGFTEDESRRIQEEAQKITDQYIGEVDKVLEGKEKELREV